MKKNVMMRIASILLVCVLATTCGISGTFAKYVTSSTMNDTARVAYWGFKEAASQEFELFKSGDAGVLNDGDGLLAPGSFDTAKFTFKYVDGENTAPEVDYTFEITVTTTSADTDLLDANPNFYWVLNDKAFKTFAELKAAIESLDGDAAKYEAGNLPAAFYTDGDATEHTIGWMWLFEVGDTPPVGMPDEIGGTPIVAVENDAGDTLMGNAVDLDDLAITITITATQVD